MSYLLCARADIKTIVDIVRVSKIFVYDLKVKVKAGVDLTSKLRSRLGLTLEESLEVVEAIRRTLMMS